MVDYSDSFKLILHAGNSKSSSKMAIEEARKLDFEEAKNKLKEAEFELNEAHKIQTNLIQEEANGKKTEMNIIMVHAQDHMSMAMSEYENAVEFIRIYHILSKLADKDLILKEGEWNENFIGV